MLWSQWYHQTSQGDFINELNHMHQECTQVMYEKYLERDFYRKMEKQI